MEFEMYNLSIKELKEYAFLSGFNIDFTDYFVVNEIEAVEDNALVHYVKNWRLKNLIIPGEFNTFEYLYNAKDVLFSGENPLLHYLTVGIHEGREPELSYQMSDESYLEILEHLRELGSADNSELISLSEDQLKAYVYYCNKQDICDDVCRQLGIETNEPLLYLTLNYNLFSLDWSSELANLIEQFENINSDDEASDESHFIDPIFSDEYQRMHGLGLDWSEFFTLNNISNEAEPIVYFLQNWQTQNLKLLNFDTKFYLEHYPDVAAAGMNPLLHFFEVGKFEGRLGSFQGLIDAHYIGGGVEYNDALPTLVIVCHESSATGAPLVGLNLGLSLVDEYNIIHITLSESTLQSEFVDNSIFTLTNLRNKSEPIKILSDWLVNTFKIEAIICNSVETYEILEVVSNFKIPVISLLHEFSEYTRPRGKITNTIINSHKTIVPAEIIAKSAFKEMKDYFGFKNEPNNIVYMPQGKLPFIPESNGSNLSVKELRTKFNISTTDKVIVGAGYVQTRKGVDLFVETAYKIKKQSSQKCQFIWVGGGYDPDWDMACSVWIHSQLEEFGLKDDFHFLNHQKSLDDIFSLADVYLLTSRLDPFPNVVIDALEADLPIVCFDKTTGCAEFLKNNKANAEVVSFLDTSEMAKSAINFLSSKVSKAGVNRKLVRKKLCFDNYVKSLIAIIDDTKKLIEERNHIESTIADSGLFNTAFYNNGEQYSKAIEYYVKTSLNGIHSVSPTPGFSVGKWFENVCPNTQYVVPLYEAITSGEKVETHDLINVTGACQVVSRKKIAVHLHLYYFDLADEFATYFSCLPQGFDLFITVCKPDLENKVIEAFANCGADKVEIVEVDNIGRDVAPFFGALKNKVYKQGYDIVGHFHSKKSNDVDEGTGDRWRKYLLANLIGSKEAINDIFAPFEDDEVGLVFAEDSHNIDFGKNKPFSDELCDAMGIKRLDNATLFPLGTMFWAKPDALSPLFELNMDEFTQPEPLPYDGSYMHAIERLISHVVIQKNYRFYTVYTPNSKW
ncbi:rhamnan synthesis F family protein [Pseudoalteromonas lipolytica]